jgi:hypothetical protein
MAAGLITSPQAVKIFRTVLKFISQGERGTGITGYPDIIIRALDNTGFNISNYLSIRYVMSEDQ